MIRTVIVPDKNTIQVSLTIPEDYIGKEIEILAYSKNEGLVKKNKTQSMANFLGILSDKTAESLREQVAKTRDEWDERLNKQY